MAVRTFGAIYIGSYEVSLKIFQVSSKRKLKEIDHIRSRLDLGKDAYAYGKIGYEQVDRLCDILSEYRHIMEGYKVEDYEIYATSILKNSENELFLLDRIALRTGMNARVLNNSELRFISYQSVATGEEFEQMIRTGAAVVDVGGSGVQITLFKKGRLVTTQHLEVGTIRLRSLFWGLGKSLAVYEQLLEEFINKRIDSFCSIYAPDGIDNVIFINDYGLEMMKSIHQKGAGVIKKEKFLKGLEKLLRKPVEELCKELDLASESDSLVVPSLMMVKCLAQRLSMNTVWFPDANINDGIAYNYAYRKKWIPVTHDFEADILFSAKALSKHYRTYSPHVEALARMSTQLFDAMKKVHGLSPRHRLLLETAAILHDVGKCVSLSNGAKCSYDLIMASEIIGLTHLEREIVALTVLYNTLPLERYEDFSWDIDKESYLVVAKLSAILRVGNALDQSHAQKFRNIRIAVKGKEIHITVESLEDISLEQVLFEGKTAYFEKVYSMKPVLKEKKVYRFD